MGSSTSMRMMSMRCTSAGARSVLFAIHPKIGRGACASWSSLIPTAIGCASGHRRRPATSGGKRATTFPDERHGDAHRSSALRRERSDRSARVLERSVASHSR
jgi:hypothetical protein